MRARPPLALLGVLVVVGFLLVVTGTATSVANQHDEPRRRALVDQVLQHRSNVEDLDAAVAELRDQVGRARDVAGHASAAQERRNQQQEELAMDAGAIAARGPGIEVHLRDAPTPSGNDGAKFTANRIQDGDLQLVVNALFAAGAEAVAINDNRVVATTSIRAAGGTIEVNYRPMSSPYTVVAIGADQARFQSSEIATHFREWKKKFDLGFSVESHKRLSVPAYSGRVGIDIAQAMTTTTTTAPTTTTTTATEGPRGAGR